MQNHSTVKDLVRMALIESKDEIQDQSDFDRMKNFHAHSLNRHKRPDETKKAFRKRVRNLIKSEHASGKVSKFLKISKNKFRPELYSTES